MILLASLSQLTVAHASEDAELLRRVLIARLAGDPDFPVLVMIGPGRPTPGLMRSADALEFGVVANGSTLVMPWGNVGDAFVYALFTPSAPKARAESLATWLHLGLTLGHKDDENFRHGLAILREKDAVAASAIEARLAPATAVVPVPPPADPANAPAGIPDRAVDVAADPTLAVDATGKPQKPARARYGALSHPVGIAGIDALMGPRANPTAARKRKSASIGDDAKESDVPLAPIIKSPIGAKTPYNFGTPSTDPGPYWTTQGQALYVPDRAGDAGVDRIHVGCYGNHTLQFVPIPAWWGGSHPEPGVEQESWKQLTGGNLGMPFFIERAYSSFSENGFMIFTSGLIAAGSVNNVPKYPCFRFPSDKWPTALSVTNRNEFLLVAVWDAKDNKAQLAVLALGLTENGKTGFCLPNWGIHNVVKLLGYVDLPGLELPSAIASTAAGDPWAAGPNESYAFDYTSADNRKRYLADPAIARSGFAVVLSKVGNKAAFVDLQPLLAGVRRNCFTTPELAAKARVFGNEDAQWPYTFKHAPEMKPVVVSTFTVPAPTAVRTSMRAAHGRPAIAAIACEKGEVRVYRVGGLLTEAPATAADIQLHVIIPVGANPCSMAYQREGDPLRPSQGQGVGSWDAINYVFLVCCRGDREIDWIEITATGGECYRRFHDKRLIDPVHVQHMRTNSGNAAYIFTVCDFQGRKIVNYRVGPAHIDDQPIPIASGAAIECTGWMEFPGSPFMVSADNVP
ncbi:MAG: hypothetical protein H0X38_01125 [Planctomycetes bacterium]|nr:hypothetical protein [Planctomycetota bacterium]